MEITKCDLCEKKIRERPYVSAGWGYENKAQLCKKCGEPILEFLVKNKLLKKEEIKYYGQK
jgi:hypothetical protein